MNETFSPFIFAVPVLVGLGFVSATITRRDRTRWSGSMKFLTTLFVLAVLLIPLVILAAPPLGP